MGKDGLCNKLGSDEVADSFKITPKNGRLTLDDDHKEMKWFVNNLA